MLFLLLVFLLFDVLVWLLFGGFLGGGFVDWLMLLIMVWIIFSRVRL